LSNSQQQHADTIIVGGGVAALWTANVLKKAGQSVCVLTNGPLGDGQSLAAQGVIHGGLKYAVGGKLNEASQALAHMPTRWLDALDGKGPVDLSKAELLSDHQILWSLPSVFSQIVSFFGSKAVRGRCSIIKREEYPSVFDSPEYKGQLFRIEEPVVDPVSILSELAAGVAEETWEVEWGKNSRLEFNDNQISGIILTDPGHSMTRLTANHFVLAAGSGNGPIMEALGWSKPQMQIRPLHQLIIRDKNLPDFYSVCVGNGSKPPLVSTTHTDRAGRKVWYIGGEIAEQRGVSRSEDEQIEAGKSLFKELMPWQDLSAAEWFTCRSQRAEPLTGTGDRPPGAFCERKGNTFIVWPTKFALAPNLADQILSQTSAESDLDPIDLSLPRPKLGIPPWDIQ
tara:strand:- start:7989 stop:9179 length:1191 start_codon:yes stop_codon:yes gene_type:complete